MLHTEYGYWISTDYATFGIFSCDNVIVSDAAPIAKWCIGKPTLDVLWYYKKKKGAIIKRLWML